MMHDLRFMNKNKTLKKVAVMLLIIIMEFGGFPVSLAFAQDGLTFETPTPSASDSAAMPVPQVSVSPELMSNPLLTEDAGTSAHFRPKIFVQQLLKRSFQAKEEVQVVVKNSGSDDLNLSIQGGTSEPAVEKTTMNGDTIFTIHPVASFRPGKYAVKVTDTTSNTVLSTQQFTWGVLAINTDKSIYLPGETANIAMAVLDEGGNMVCTAQVDLEIDSPNGAATKLSTTDGSIVVNPECRIHNFTMKPDYEASYKTAETGRYVTTLTATTQKGSYMVKDRFEVRHSVPFDVTRDTATRVYPAHVYPVQLHVRAQEDFSGKIVETVPTDFQISQLADNSSLPYAQENDIPQNTAKEKNPSIPNLRLPFDGHYQVTLGFGQQVDDPEDHSVYKKSGLDGHDGIDFGLPENTPVLAVDDGKVVLAQENWIYGTSVVIQHRWGRTYYGHLSKLSVTVGQQVTAGTEIGLSGHTGLATGPHLHFGMKPNTSDINNLYFGKIDPAPYFGISSDDPVLSVSDYPGATMALVWNVNVQKGAEFTLGYQYKAPNKSPNFYTIGPLQFISSKITPEEQARFDVKDNPFVLGVATSSGVLIPADQKVSKVSDITTADNQQISNMVVFEEIRPWQLAIDAATTIIITSSYTDPCGSNCWTVPSDWNDSNNTIEVVGPGGNGSTSTTLPGSGGGGGGYAAKASSTATSFTPGASISFQIGTGGSGSATWFSTSAYLSGGAGGNGTNGSISSGGAGSGTAATTTSSGGTGADSISSVGSGGGGGGGAGGPNGAGHNGGTPITQAGGGGGGGGGNGGGSGSNGSNSVSASGGNGGNGNGGTGGGTGGTGIGGNATAGTGGGGAGGAGTTAAGGAFAGGNGAAGTDMAGGSVGTGGGGGGGGGNSRTTSTGNNGGAGGIPTADSGAGGGGGGDCTDAGCTEGAGKTGANGFIVITYTPLITGPTLDQLMRHGDWFSSGVRKSFTF